MAINALTMHILLSLVTGWVKKKVKIKSTEVNFTVNKIPNTWTQRHKKETEQKLTPEASCEPCRPSVYGCAPSGCACFWRRYPWPSGRDCGTWRTKTSTCQHLRTSQRKNLSPKLEQKHHRIIHQCWRDSNLHVPVNFLGLPVATKKTTQDSHSPHPWQLFWHTSIGCTLSFTYERGKSNYF